MSENDHKQHHQVIFMPSGRRGLIQKDTSILEAARQLGVTIESICGGRMTCSKCRIAVEAGHFQKHGITSHEDHLSQATDEECRFLEKLNSPGQRLSCQATVQGDILIFVPEESRGQKQIIRKAATDRVIEIDTAVRQYYIEVDQAELGEHRGDWGRLQGALAAQWHLEDLTVDLPVLRRLQSALRKGKWAVTVTIWQNEVIDVQAGYVEGIYGLAVDIGSTTIAGFLCDLRTGEVIATESVMNPQITYGEDLMSRISYTMMNNDGLDKMHKAIIDTLNRLAASAAKEANIRARDIHEAVFVGNTTMVHILLGIDPIELGGAPFALANRDAMDIKAHDLGLRLHRGANIHVLPAEAGHVGADNVSVLIAEEPYKQMDDIVLTVDVGTNAEIVLGNQEWMFSASSPTGPAFEGAQITHGMRAAPGAIERVRIDPITKVANFRVIGEEVWSVDWQLGADVPADDQPSHLAAGICGSGIIEVVAEMFTAGVLQGDGRFDPNLQYERVLWDGRKGSYVLATDEQSTTGEPIVVTQDDVRNIQLAKAALYAGCKLLMNKAEIKTVDRIILAGAFGSFIEPKYAMILGLIPDCALEKVTAVGNAAGDGARIALLNKQKRIEAQEIAEWVRYVETAIDPAFQDEFVGAIHLPHASDTFPHLEGFLPAKPETEAVAEAARGGSGRSRSRRRKKRR